jgi:hypothetical protein
MAQFRAMRVRRARLLLLAGVALVCSAAIAASAQASTTPAHVTVHVQGVHGGAVHVGNRVRISGKVRPFVPGEHVKVTIARNGHSVKKVKLRTRPTKNATTHLGQGTWTAVPTGAGRFSLRSPRLIRPGSYRVSALHSRSSSQNLGRAADHTGNFSISYPDLHVGERSSDVHLFAHLLAADGYYTSHGPVYGADMQRAVLAFRKVNGMSRIYDATPGIFKTVAAHKGAYKLRYPNAGRHVEVSINHQVMTLADHGKPIYTFPVSTGAPATPTITGHYSFYRKSPGYNSEGMYYSAYWHGGYAVHGYHSVPTYNASHGCVRVPIPDAVFIYNWIQLGESIYVYY